MTTRKERALDKGESGTAKRGLPQHEGGDQARKAQEWGGGTKAAKGRSQSQIGAIPTRAKSARLAGPFTRVLSPIEAIGTRGGCTLDQRTPPQS